MTEADPNDTMPSAGFEPLAADLEPWFENEVAFEKLPSKVRKWIIRALGPAMAAALWTASPPRHRRLSVQRRDVEQHPDLTRERHALQKKLDEIEYWEEVAANISHKDRPAEDVKAQKEELIRIHAEYAAVETTLRRKAASFGLAWPYGGVDEAPDALPRSAMTLRTRKGRHDWGPASQKISAHIYANGLPEPGDGGQARLEKLAMSMFPLGKCPSESAIRARVVKAIELARAALNEGR
jgi:hypothetical protein